MKTEKQMAAAATEFAERWKGRGYERGESQPFWIDLLSNVFGIDTPTNGFITFEDHRMVDASNSLMAAFRQPKYSLNRSLWGRICGQASVRVMVLYLILSSRLVAM